MLTADGLLFAPCAHTQTRRSLTTAAAASCSFSTAAPAAPATERTTFGNLKDQDRIFQNIYGRHDISIKVCALTRAPPLAAAARCLG